MGSICSGLCKQERNTHVANYYFQMWKLPDQETGTGGASDSFQRDELPTRSAEDIRGRYQLSLKGAVKGGFGQVVIGKLRGDDSQQSAIKIIRKADHQSDANAIKEAEMLRKLDHPNIVKFREVYEDNDCFYIVLENLRGGDLMKLLEARRKLDEDTAREYVWQILLATNYLHTQRIVHADLKPENFVLVSPGSTWLKMIDFGLADILKRKDYLSALSGSRYYIAPEVLAGKHTERRDLWSLGVILYLFAVGFYPFYAEDEDSLFERISDGKYDLDTLRDSGFSAEAVDLCQSLLSVNPEMRPTAHQALEHAWFASQRAKVQQRGLAALCREQLVSLKNYKRPSDFKKEAMSVAAQMCEDTQAIEQIARIFLLADEDYTGTISRREFEVLFRLAKIDFEPEEIDAVIDALHLKEKNSVSFMEFTAGMLIGQLLADESKLEAVFKLFDNNGDGKICKADLNVFFSRSGRCLTLDKINSMISEVDINNDREISLEEFIEAMRR